MLICVQQVSKWRRTYRLMYGLIYSFINWLTGSLIDWSVGWLIDETRLDLPHKKTSPREHINKHDQTDA